MNSLYLFTVDINGNIKKFSVDRTKNLNDDPDYQAFPSCFDPTYCETHPPVPKMNNTEYSKPPIGSLRYNDGEVVTYKCLNPSKKNLQTSNNDYFHYIIQSYHYDM